MHTAIVPKNGSDKRGIDPSTVVIATIRTGRTLLTQPPVAADADGFAVGFKDFLCLIGQHPQRRGIRALEPRV